MESFARRDCLERDQSLEILDLLDNLDDSPLGVLTHTLVIFLRSLSYCARSEDLKLDWLLK